MEFTKLTYPSPNITTPFSKDIKIVFADDVATGRPSPIIDSQMQKEVLPFYSNTHSNAFCGMKMKKEIDSVREIIRKDFDLSLEHKILFTGNGATGAVNHLTNIINFDSYKKITIFISEYEHYSNHLPWLEKMHEDKKINIVVIPIVDYELDLNFLERNLKIPSTSDHLHIISITACSNVTGVITQLSTLKHIVKKAKSEDKKIYLFIDCACIGPYKKISCKQIDGIYISMHKFLGGYGTPGILIAHENLFAKTHPYCPGGGCVKKVTGQNVQYDEDIEKRESGGTPNITGIIKIKYVLELKNKLFNQIEKRESKLVVYLHNYLKKIVQKNPNFKVIGLLKCLDRRLPIISFGIDGLHYNFIVVLLNDLFGIQSRGGISCCGMLNSHIPDYKLDGWCRITFSWLMDDKTIIYILRCIEFIVKYGNTFQKYYKYNKDINLFEYDFKETYDIDIKKMLEISLLNINP